MNDPRSPESDGRGSRPDNLDTDGDPDAELLAACGDALVAAADATVPAWIGRLLAARLGDVGIDVAAEPWASQVAEAVAATTADVHARLRSLVDTDVDEQRSTPLQVLAGAVRFATDVLAAAEVAPVKRDEWEERSFPADRYALAPAALSDVDAALHEPGLVWGAAKAHVILTRRRSEGRL